MNSTQRRLIRAAKGTKLAGRITINHKSYDYSVCCPFCCEETCPPGDHCIEPPDQKLLLKRMSKAKPILSYELATKGCLYCDDDSCDGCYGETPPSQGQPLVKKNEEPGFPKFALLAPELRNTIWEFGCFVPRIIDLWGVNVEEIPAAEVDSVWGYRGSYTRVPWKYKSHVGVPALMHTNQEARSIALGHYVLSFGNVTRDADSIWGPAVIPGPVVATSPARIWVNRYCDIICPMPVNPTPQGYKNKTFQKKYPARHMFLEDLLEGRFHTDISRLVISPNMLVYTETILEKRRPCDLLLYPTRFELECTLHLKKNLSLAFLEWIPINFSSGSPPSSFEETYFNWAREAKIDVQRAVEGAALAKKATKYHKEGRGLLRAYSTEPNVVFGQLKVHQLN